jgi:hypothetical protein
MTLREGKIEIVPVTATPIAGTAWARELYAVFAPVRRKARAMDVAEVDALIDEGIAEVRSQDNE